MEENRSRPSRLYRRAIAIVRLIGNTRTAKPKRPTRSTNFQLSSLITAHVSLSTEGVTYLRASAKAGEAINNTTEQRLATCRLAGQGDLGIRSRFLRRRGARSRSTTMVSGSQSAGIILLEPSRARCRRVGTALTAGDCKEFMIKHLKCMTENKGDVGKCRLESRRYLECRMDQYVGGTS